MKKLILSLFVLLVGIINFGYCLDEITVPGNNFVAFEYDITEGGHNYIGYRSYTFTVIDTTLVHFSNDYDMVCLRKQSQYQSCSWSLDGNKWYGVALTSMNCFGTDEEVYLNGCDPVYSYYFSNGDPLLPKLTSLECQSEYSLIPISSIDTNYCVGNGFCPINECTGGITSGTDWSALYINNLQFPGKSIIDISIPDYITWDYSTSDEEFDLYVGSGYDQDYIDSIIGINSYRPDSGDFTNIFVSGLTLIFPYIVITLFIVFVWRLLKRIFR